VAFEQLPTGTIAQLPGPSGAIDDVGKQHRGQRPIGVVAAARSGHKLLDLVGDRLHVPEPRRVDVAGQLDVTRARDLAGHP